jgi:alkanesulfonate monooxygenase SsuD/methylene tetrahydromethanopterin reductase-like flavin-dependent oxidoreductase (luciferase family)
MDELLQKEGRDPSSMKRSLMTQVIYARDEAKLQEKMAARNTTPEQLWEANGVIAGTGSMVVDRVGQFAEAGIERFMLQWIDLDDIDGMEAMAKEVLPHFHK